jgi:periplasmic protein TonB
MRVSSHCLKLEVLARTYEQAESDAIGKFTAGSAALHLAVAGAFILYAFISGHLHHESWGANETQGAIAATLVSNAPAIPLPQDQPPSPSVLATETPSTAPAPTAPQPKAIQQPEPDAVPIPMKQQPAPPKKTPAPEAKQLPHQATDSRASRYPSQLPAQPNRANYGEAAPAMSRSMNSNQGPNNPVNIKGGDFGSQFPYYVDAIKRKVASNWYQQQVESSTRAGSRVYLNFTVSRDGVPNGIRVATSSGSSTLDTSCLRAVQRVDTFGPLPSGYNQSSISVEYYCEYAGANR